MTTWTEQTKTGKVARYDKMLINSSDFLLINGTDKLLLRDSTDSEVTTVWTNQTKS